MNRTNKMRLPSINRKLVEFSSLEFLFWITCSAYHPFLAIYLESKACSSTVIGTIFSINSFIIILSQPFWGAVSDRLQSVKKVFILCLSATAVLLLSLPLYQSVLLIGLMLAIITFFESSLPPLLDSWVIQGLRDEENIAYGHVRLWGSIGFAAMVLVFGKIIDLTSIYIIFPAYTLFGFFTILQCTRIKTDKPASPTSFKDLKIGRLLKNYYYLTFVIFATILFIPHRSAFTFLPKLMDSVGGTKAEFGLAVCVMAFSEAPVFLFSKYLVRKYKPIKLILLSSIFFIVRQLLYMVATSPIHVILIHVLQGPSYGLFLIGAVYYMDSLAPQELKSTAQTLGTSIYSGLSGILGSYAGGWIIDQMNLSYTYQIGFYLTAAGTILFLMSFPLAKLSHRTNPMDV